MQPWVVKLPRDAGFPDDPVGKNPPANAGLGRSPWRREWQPTPVFLPWKSHEQRSLAGYTVHGVLKELDMTEHSTAQHTEQKLDNTFLTIM